MDYLISSSAGILAVLAGITSFFFFLEKKTEWKFFNYFPPLIFIYLLPVVLSNTGIIPSKSGVYDFMGDSILPVFLILMLINVNLGATIRVMGKGVFVMLAGTLGVVIGAPVGLFLVRSGLDPSSWQGFGTLSGSWIGGTGNMLAVAQMIELDEASVNYGYAVIADNAVYLIWLPILLGSKNLASWFHRFTGVSDKRLQRMEDTAKELIGEKGKLQMRHILYLAFFGFAGCTLAAWLSEMILVTIIGLGLSITRAKTIPGSQALAMALIYLFVARMGAKADLSGISMTLFWFLLGAYIWIFIHGLFLLGAARLFKVDVHTAAIASAANIGGAASAPIVAAYHRPTLVPVSILMAMIGYAVGNPAGWLTAMLCRMVST
jgi:uncharacterized membrane protein